MSSTKRGGQRSPSDNYPTPHWVTNRIIDRLCTKLPMSGIWYEPCAGDGSLIHPFTVRKLCPTWWANEIREEERPRLSVSVPRAGVVTTGDILDPSTPLPPKDQVQVVITNPPYRIAWELLHKMLREFPDSHIILLLRVNFIASQGRYGFMSQYMPDVYVLPNRPGFKGWGKTDSPEYGWFHFPPSPRARTEGKIELLALTSREERRRAPDAGIVYPEETAD